MLSLQVFCQLIKQTAVVHEDQVDNQLVTSAWQILSCMVCAFVPERAIQRYLVMHVKRILEKYPDSEMAKFAEYCSQNMRRTKQREYPPSRNEIIACLGRRELKAVVYSYGGASCNITIDSATTAQQVVSKLKLGMGIRTTANRFGLFEVCGDISKVIDDRSTVADVLAKFEQYREQRLQPGETPQKWILFFKIFCFTDISSVPLDSVEGTIMFEQACDMVVRGHFPVEEDEMIELAALRQQYLEGDYDPEESTITDLTRLYPLHKIREEAEKQKDILGPKNIQQKYETISKGKNWLSGTLTRAKGKEYSEEERSQDALTAKMGQVRQLVVQQWKKLQGMEDSDAQRRYMDIVMQWDGFGCSIQDIKYVLSDQRFPQDLWLAIGCRSVSLYERGKKVPLKTYRYEQIESFGAPYPNKFKFVAIGEDSMLFETSRVSVPISM
jgi:myosin X